MRNPSRPHNSRWQFKHDGKVGRSIRLLKKEEHYESGEVSYRWTPRGRASRMKRELDDPDLFEWRGKHSTGWKEHRYRHQWEYRVRMAEKRRRNRRLKKLRRDKKR